MNNHGLRLMFEGKYYILTAERTTGPKNVSMERSNGFDDGRAHPGLHDPN